MAIDGVTLAAIKLDLNNKIIGARINKIYQPEDKILTVDLRQPGEDIRLLISISPQYSTVHLTELEFENPPSPPAFCMLLRKYLTNGNISEIRQPDFERILHIQIENNNRTFTLILEIMGRYSNVILVSDENRVLDAMKRITKKISRERQLYPGIEYKIPPPQDKANPLEVSREEFFTSIPDDFGKYCFKALMYNFRGLGPDMAREIVHRTGIDYEQHYSDLDERARNKIYDSFREIFKRVKNGDFQPALGQTDDGNIKYTSGFPLTHLEKELETLNFPATGSLFDYYYQHQILNRKYRRLKQRLTEIVENYLKKNRKKQRELKGQLHEAKQAEKYKQRGELITANIYRIDKGQEEVTVENYFDPEEGKITIKLDPAKEPAQNAQQYFKKYEKVKKSHSHLKKELGKFRHEERYLEQVMVNIEQAENRDELSEIEVELKEEGYIKKQTGSKKKNKPLPPRKFKSSQGYDILVGRNNRQNDHLTKKVAQNHDLWVHTRKIAGSHVIIRNHTGGEIPEETILEAARLAAYYSKGRMSGNVPVDYTKVKNVNKPKGARPGLVYYEHHNTVYVEPASEI